MNIRTVKGYPYFQPNQVLGDQDLNQLREYLELSERGTRAETIGTGIVCGLKTEVLSSSPTPGDTPGTGAPDPASQTVSLAPGVAITSEGYLVQIPERMEFDAAVPYADANRSSDLPFPPTTDDGTDLLFELVDSTTQDGTATPLSDLWGADGATQTRWGNPIVALYLEFKEIPRLKCSFDDCDDKGLSIEVNLRTLLIPQSPQWKVEPFVQERRTNLIPLRMPRVRGFSSDFDIETAYGDAATEADLLTSLSHRLTLTLQVYESLLSPGYPTPSPFYVPTRQSGESSDAGAAANESDSRLDYGDVESNIEQAIRDALSRVGDGPAQLEYDFMRDLVDAYNEFISVAARWMGACSEPQRTFRRHVLLGQPREPFDGREITSAFRHYFRPALKATEREGLALRAVALHKRIEAMLTAFDPEPRYRGKPHIRPQRRAGLSPHAIPYYYNLDPKLGLRRHWNPADWDSTRLTEAPIPFQPGADPFEKSARDVTFLRVEGHLGANFDPELVTHLESLRAQHALPFDLAVVDASAQPQRLPEREWLKRLPNYRELAMQHDALRHRLSQVLREGGAYVYGVQTQLAQLLYREGLELPEVAPFRAAITQAISALGSPLVDFDPQPLRAAREQLFASLVRYLADIRELATRAISRPLLGGASSKAAATNTAAYYAVASLTIGELRAHLLALFSDFDCNTLLFLHQRATEAARAARDADLALFDNFAEAHPGLDHLSGVTCGGTFVMVHAEGKVVADFQLPYLCRDVVKPAADDQPLVPEHDLYLERDLSLPLTQPIKLALVDGELLAGRFDVPPGARFSLELTTGVEPLIENNPLTIPQANWSLSLVADPEAPGAPLLVSEFLEQELGGLDEPYHFTLLVDSPDATTRLARIRIWVHVRWPVVIAGEDSVVTTRNRAIRIPLLPDDVLPFANPSVTLSDTAANGELSEIDETGSVEYRPPLGFVGRDSFTYRIAYPGLSDSGVPMESQTRVTIQVTDRSLDDVDARHRLPPELSLPHWAYCEGDDTDYPISLLGSVSEVSGPGVNARTAVTILDAQKTGRDDLARAIAEELSSPELSAQLRASGLKPLRDDDGNLLTTSRPPQPGEVRWGSLLYPLSEAPFAAVLAKYKLDPSIVAAERYYVFNPERVPTSDTGPIRGVTLSYELQTVGDTTQTGNFELTLLALPRQASCEASQPVDSGAFTSVTAQFSYGLQFDPNELPIAFEWRFGDGQFSSEQSPSHEYRFPIGEAPPYVDAALAVRVPKAPNCSVSIPTSVVLPSSFPQWLTQLIQDLRDTDSALADRVSAGQAQIQKARDAQAQDDPSVPNDEQTAAQEALTQASTQATAAQTALDAAIAATKAARDAREVAANKALSAEQTRSQASQKIREAEQALGARLAEVQDELAKAWQATLSEGSQTEEEAKAAAQAALAAALQDAEAVQAAQDALASELQKMPGLDDAAQDALAALKKAVETARTAEETEQAARRLLDERQQALRDATAAKALADERRSAADADRRRALDDEIREWTESTDEAQGWLQRFRDSLLDVQNALNVQGESAYRNGELDELVLTPSITRLNAAFEIIRKQLEGTMGSTAPPPSEFGIETFDSAEFCVGVYPKLVALALRYLRDELRPDTHRRDTLRDVVTEHLRYIVANAWEPGATATATVTQAANAVRVGAPPDYALFIDRFVADLEGL